MARSCALTAALALLTLSCGGTVVVHRDGADTDAFDSTTPVDTSNDAKSEVETEAPIEMCEGTWVVSGLRRAACCGGVVCRGDCTKTASGYSCSCGGIPNGCPVGQDCCEAVAADSGILICDWCSPSK